MSTAEPGGDERCEQDGEHERQSGEVERHDAEVEVQPAGERGCEQRTEAREGHLTERQLSGPSGEDGERQPADREAGDRGVQQVARRRA